MKKVIVFSGVMASALMSSYGASAASQPTDLTTRNYVDEGLSFVYQKAKTADDKATDLQTAIGTKGNANTDPSGLAGDIATLEDMVGVPADGNEPATGLHADVADLQGDVSDLADEVTDLQETVSNLQDATQTYTNGTGITVTPGEDDDPSSIGLALPNNAANGASYVFQSDGNGGGSWVQLQVTNTWDAAAEERITGGN